MSHILSWLLQVEDVCKTLAGFPELKHGYNAIGFSQGMPLLTNCKPGPCHLHSRRFYRLVQVASAMAILHLLDGDKSTTGPQLQALRSFTPHDIALSRSGGQFMRAVVERCQHTGPKAHTLITLGGQHQGVMNMPSCWNPSLNMTPSYMCSASARFLGWGATLPFIRTRLVQAQYFKVMSRLHVSLHS